MTPHHRLAAAATATMLFVGGPATADTVHETHRRVWAAALGDAVVDRRGTLAALRPAMAALAEETTDPRIADAAAVLTTQATSAATVLTAIQDELPSAPFDRIRQLGQAVVAMQVDSAFTPAAQVLVDLDTLHRRCTDTTDAARALTLAATATTSVPTHVAERATTIARDLPRTCDTAMDLATDIGRAAATQWQDTTAGDAATWDRQLRDATTTITTLITTP